MDATPLQPHLEHAISRADQCLYKAKPTGRNRVVAWRGGVAAQWAATTGAATADRTGHQAAGMLAALMDASTDAVISGN